MERQNFYNEQLIGVDEMMALQNTAQDAIKEALAELGATGILFGVGVMPTTPVNTLSVVIQSGKVALENGALVTTGENTSIDLSGFYNDIPPGNQRWVALYAIPKTVNDTPVVTPIGDTINYRSYDYLEFVPVAGDISPAPSLPDSGATREFQGVLVADVLLTAGTPIIANGAISLNRKQVWFTLPAIIDMIKTNTTNHTHAISAITGLQAVLDNKAPLGHTHTVGEIVSLQALLDGKATSVHSHNISQVTGLQVALDGKSNVGHVHENICALGAGSTEDTGYLRLGPMCMAWAKGAEQIISSEVWSSSFVTLPVRFSKIMHVNVTTQNVATSGRYDDDVWYQLIGASGTQVEVLAQLSYVGSAFEHRIRPCIQVFGILADTLTESFSTSMACTELDHNADGAITAADYPQTFARTLTVENAQGPVTYQLSNQAGPATWSLDGNTLTVAWASQSGSNYDVANKSTCRITISDGRTTGYVDMEAILTQFSTSPTYACPYGDGLVFASQAELDNHIAANHDNGGGGGGGGGCPAPEVLIYMTDGSSKLAGDLKVGDWVLSWDEEAQKFVHEQVTHAERSCADRWYIRLSTGIANKYAWNHRFLLASGEWREINALQVGDELVGATVEAVFSADHGEICKITINRTHTMVTDGVVSHNLKDAHD